MGIIAYELLLLGVISIFIQQKWIFRIRRYLVMGFLTSGMILTTISLKEMDDFVFMYFLVCTIALVIGCIYVLVYTAIKKETCKKEILYIPAGEYEIVVADNYTSPNTQIKYLLKYKNKIYFLSAIPPEGTPALIMYTSQREGSDITTASIAIDESAQPVTMERVMKKIRSRLVFTVAVLLPIFYTLWNKGILNEDYSESCLMIIIAYAFSAFTQDSKILLQRCIYYFGRFLEIAGWLSIFVKLFL